MKPPPKPNHRPRRRWRLIVRVANGERRPRGYGLVGLDLRTCTTTHAPVPLNVVLRLGRWAWLWLAHPLRMLDGQAGSCYWQGRAERLERERDAATREADELVARLRDAYRTQLGMAARVDQLQAAVRDLHHAIENHNRRVGDGGDPT